jgi:hypothetical protein
VNDQEMRCEVCTTGLGVSSHDGGFIEPFCRTCLHRYPASLLKSVIDPFMYALKLRTGEVVYFQECRIDGAYAHLTLQELYMGNLIPDGVETVVHGGERGIDVRVDDIVWCVDAPFGS